MGKENIGVIGVGYVGFPLAISLSRSSKIVAYDMNKEKIEKYKNGLGVDNNTFKNNKNLHFTNNSVDLENVDTYIICIPTPVDVQKKPDLTLLCKATEMISSFLKKGKTIIFESTVYPGATDNICIPILEKGSGLIANKDFYVGYSPERVNPGDTKQTIENVFKIIGSPNKFCREKMYGIYGKMNSNKIFILDTIIEAEAAKLLENIQRDVNIALMNEFSLISKKMGFNMSNVLNAAKTKWNFCDFKPGLVGGHCISVDPYYLISSVESFGIKANLIETARKVNENMTDAVMKKIKKFISICDDEHIKIGIVGISFKRDCGDIRNSKVIDIAHQMKLLKNIEIHVEDYLVESKDKESFKNVSELSDNSFNILILGSNHSKYLNRKFDYYKKKFKSNGGIIIDLDNFINTVEEEVNIEYWSM